MKSRIRKRLVFLTSTIVVLSISSDITSAFLLTQTTTIENKFESARINIRIVEQKSPEDEETYLEDLSNPTQEYIQIKQNETVDKIIAIQNYDNPPNNPTADTWVRVRLVPIVRDKDGNNLGEVEVEYVYEDEEHWKKQGMYYYYNQVLKPGEKTSHLIKQVKLLSELPEKSYLEIQVLAEGVQAHPMLGEVANKEATPVYELWGIYPTAI